MLSLKLLSFSNTIKVQNSIIRTVHPYLEQISLKYGEIAHCGVAQGDSVIYVDKVESSRSLSINTQIGTKNYLHCTGVGKCILAYMPEDEQQHILAGPLKALTFNTIVDPRQLQAELRHIRADATPWTTRRWRWVCPAWQCRCSPHRGKSPAPSASPA